MNSLEHLLSSPLLSHPVSFFLEGFIVAFVIWKLFNRKSRLPTAPVLSKEEEDEIIEQWQPEPFVPSVDPGHYSLNPRVVSSMYGKFVTVDDKPCLNMATHNYLGFVENEECIEAAIKAVKQYGVGSCGPRGFFGTVDVHLELEKEIAEFMEAEEAILYSYGYSAISSAIPAYSKQNDVIFCDEGVNFAIQQGLVASRSTIHFFRHNDVDHLAQLLLEQSKKDAKNPKAAKTRSRFLIVEGLYINYGDICPLPEMIKLKNQYKVRLFIDDTCGLGVLGAHGRGIVEHTNSSMEDVDLIAASLEYACAGYGGFCAGTHYIIDHQRLSGLGYCFSASLPPLQAAVGLRAIKLLQSRPSMVSDLRERCLLVDRLLAKHRHLVRVEGDPISPLKHLRFASAKSSSKDHTFQTARLEKVVAEVFDKGLALTVARYLDQMEHNLPEPSIRLAISVLVSEDELEQSVRSIVEAFELVEKKSSALED